MASRICLFVLGLLILSSTSARTSPFSSNDGAPLVNHHYHEGHKSQEPLQVSKDLVDDPQLHSNQVNEEAYSRGLRRIGSMPPNCEHKCFGCTPCEAIQVPEVTRTTNRDHKVHFGLDYANYEPEGWKCKCGHSIYSP